ncbi:uncharacterized protein J3R85_020459 [Psidium guajava]|nr:uncharacterized protein J3R85_020459 [Psidium guajava]
MTKGIVSTQQQEQHQQQEDGQSIGSSSSGSSGAGTGSGGGGLALKKGPWTAAEDAVLIEHVKKNGEGNWNSVQKNTGLARCGKSCRLRWTNHLRPNLKKGSFTPEEERLILKLHSQLGNKWARMATQVGLLCCFPLLFFELPSSQSYLSQIGKPEIDVKQRLGVYRSGSGLLEDLLEEAQALSNENLQTPTFMNLRAEKLNVSLRSGCDWDARSSVDGSAANLGHSHYEIDTHKGFGLPLAQEGTDAENVAAQQIYAMEEEDFSKLLNAVPSTLQRGNLGHSTPDIDTSASAEADITMGGHEMQQQIAPSHPASTAVDNEITLGPSSWDNLPGIC